MNNLLIAIRLVCDLEESLINARCDDLEALVDELSVYWLQLTQTQRRILERLEFGLKTQRNDHDDTTRETADGP